MSDDKINKISFFETLTLAAGFTIGSGIITLTGIGIAFTGKSISLAFLVTAILFLIAVRPLILLSSVLPRTSAAYTYSKELIGNKVGGFFAYIYFAGRITIAIFGISFAQYLASLIPALNDPLLLKFIGISVLSLFFIINLFGIKCAAKIQNILFLVLMIGLLTYVIFGVPKAAPIDFGDGTFFTGGFKGFYTAVSLLFFALGGSYIITDFAPSIKNPSKTIPKVVVFVTLGVCLLYMLIGFVASGVLPLEKAAGMPLSVSAEVIFPIPALKIVFIVGGALGALVTTLNSSFVWYSNSLIEPCVDGWFPKLFTLKNKYNVPYILMTVFYLFGLIPILFDIDLTILSKIAVGLTIFSLIIPMAGILKIDKKYPDEWKKSGFKKKYSLRKRKIMLFITYIILATQVIYLLQSNPPLSNLIIGVYVLIVIIYLNRHNTHNDRLNNNC